MNEQSREQKLVDICFSCVLTVLNEKYRDSFIKMSQEERAEWVAKQLKGCGFPTEPSGASWGRLKNN